MQQHPDEDESKLGAQYCRGFAKIPRVQIFGGDARFLQPESHIGRDLRSNNSCSNVIRFFHCYALFETSTAALERAGALVLAARQS